MENSENEKIRFKYLDGIRGIAALLIVFCHFKYSFFDSSANTQGFTFFWKLFDFLLLSAALCVHLFFVLSGFVLAYNSFNRDAFLTKQLVKRFFRLFAPVFISSLFYFLAISNHLFSFKSLAQIHSSAWINEQWSANYLVQSFLWGSFYKVMILTDTFFITNINSSLWTIPIELYWSYILFFCFFILKLVKPLLLKNILLSIIILSIIKYFPFRGSVYGTLFLCGAIMAVNYSHLIIFFTKTNKIYLLAGTVLFTIFIDQGWLPSVDDIAFMWSFIVAVSLILSVLVMVSLQRILSVRFIAWLGRISFPLYLLHMLVIGIVSAGMFVQVPFFRADTGLIFLLLITLFVALAFAHFFTFYIDEPLMRFFDTCYKKILAKPKHKLVS